MSRLLISRNFPKFQLENGGLRGGRYAQVRGYTVGSAISRSGLGGIPPRVGTAVRLGFSACASFGPRRGYAGPGGGGGLPTFNLGAQLPNGEALKQHVGSFRSGGLPALGSAHWWLTS